MLDQEPRPEPCRFEPQDEADRSWRQRPKWARCRPVLRQHSTGRPCGSPNQRERSGRAAQLGEGWATRREPGRLHRLTRRQETIETQRGSRPSSPPMCPEIWRSASVEGGNRTASSMNHLRAIGMHCLRRTLAAHQQETQGSWPGSRTERIYDPHNVPVCGPPTSREVRHGILGAAVDTDLEVEMVTGRRAGRTAGTDRFALRDRSSRHVLL